MKIAVWHVRSVRPIREQGFDSDTVTRIELANGDVLDRSESVVNVLLRIEEALKPIENGRGIKLPPTGPHFS